MDELPLHIVNQCEFVEMVTNTTKPLMVLIAGGPELSDIYDMAGERHTREHFRELWLPSVLSWESRSTWAAAGATTLRERARAKVFEVWEEHVVEPLPEDVLQGMKAVIEARRAAPPAIEA